MIDDKIIKDIKFQPVFFGVYILVSIILSKIVLSKFSVPAKKNLQVKR